jgi:hypothetical protein
LFLYGETEVYFIDEDGDAQVYGCLDLLGDSYFGAGGDNSRPRVSMEGFSDAAASFYGVGLAVGELRFGRGIRGIAVKIQNFRVLAVRCGLDMLVRGGSWQRYTVVCEFSAMAVLLAAGAVGGVAP